MSSGFPTDSVFNYLCHQLENNFFQFSEPVSKGSSFRYESSSEASQSYQNSQSYQSSQSCQGSQSYETSCYSSTPESEPGSWFVERKKVGRSKHLKKSSIPSTICGFCKKNGEPVEYYSKHVLKDPYGIVVCPVLRRYNCPYCNNGGGDYAHTARFCPYNPVDRTVDGRPLPEILRTTGRNSFGKKNK